MHWYSDPIPLSTVVIATATVVNLVVSFLLWRSTAGATNVTKKIFEASHRPYIGITQVDTDLGPAPDRLAFKCYIKNFGSIPAINVTILETTVIVDGHPVNLNRDEFGTFSVFPTSEMYHNVMIRNAPDAAQVLSHGRLELYVSLRYEGLAKHKYGYKYHALYNASGQFMPLKEEITEESIGE